ncbi:MAG: glycosyltransferase [Treponema sp.]|nr:glycosyltransferase [Treponema sp.]
MKRSYKTPIILIRKKQVGENSIEEIAYRLSKDLNIPVVCVPYYSTSIINLMKNIIFARQLAAPVFHILTPSEAYLLPFLKGKKCITYHDLGTVFNARNKIYKLMRIFLHILPSKYFADRITFVSEQTKQEWLKTTKSKKKDILSVIYNAYDERLIPQESSIKNEAFTILQIGTAKRKNLISTIRACDGLNVKLNIIGKLNEEQKNELTNLKINYKNSFDISYEEVIENYRNCDIVCFPTFYEGFGVPLIEANAMHKPIIAGDIPVLHEIGENAAFFVNPNSVEEIRTAIKRLMMDEGLRTQLVESGIENAKKYEHRHIACLYKKLYEELLEKKN